MSNDRLFHADCDAHERARKHTYLHIHIHTNIYKHMHMQMYMHVQIDMHMRTCTCKCKCTCNMIMLPFKDLSIESSVSSQMIWLCFSWFLPIFDRQHGWHSCVKMTFWEGCSIYLLKILDSWWYIMLSSSRSSSVIVFANFKKFHDI